MLVSQPRITVPTVSLGGDSDGIMLLGGSEGHRQFFTGIHERHVILLAGHNVPQEAPTDFTATVLPS